MKIIKEFIILLVLMIVIVMLLALTFYEYMPKTALSVLNKYTRDEKVSAIIQEINTSEIADSTKKDVIKSYSITPTDLEAYKILNIYQDTTRPDPFSPLMYSAKYDTSISGKSSDIIKYNKENSTNKNTNSTGYFSTSSKTK